MSKKKNKGNNPQGWQKVSTQPAEQAEPKTEEIPQPEPAAETTASEEPKEQPEIQTGDESKEESQPEPEAEPDTENKPQEEEPDKTKPKAKKRRKHAAAAPLGMILSVLAVIGLVNVIFFGVHFTERLIDNSAKKEEFGDIILPVLMFDPVPFENPNEMGELALLRSSIWAALLNESDKYVVGDGNMVAVPQSDVDVACAKLFGSEVTLKHQAFEDYITMYTFDTTTKSYFVPVDATIMYTPKVEEISRSGSIYDLTVGYMTPENQWLQGIKGKKSEPVPTKYMVYTLKKVDDHYQLISIKDPPEGVVPGLPPIPENAPAPQTPPPTSIPETPVQAPTDKPKEEVPVKAPEEKTEETKSQM